MQIGLIVQVHRPADVLAIIVGPVEGLELRVIGRVHHDGVDVLPAQLLQPSIQGACHVGGRQPPAGVGAPQVPDHQRGLAWQYLLVDQRGLLGHGTVAPSDRFDVDGAAGRQGAQVLDQALLQPLGQRIAGGCGQRGAQPAADAAAGVGTCSIAGDTGRAGR